ncbi:MAG: hypothetical protein PHV05_08080 [Candidatus Riflebacteria bacterium]|nr:hypothetical protein [Candidatus Riflebacteria bacterium]
MTSTVQPFEDYAIGEENERVQQILVSDYTAIVAMTSIFAFQGFHHGISCLGEN